MTQAKQAPPQTADRQTAPQSDIIVSDTLYQVDDLEQLERQLIAFLYSIWKAKGIRKKIVKTS